MKFLALLTLGLGLTALTACQPADEKARSVKERLEAGEFVEFDKPGYLRPACTHGAWTDFRIEDETERSKIILGRAYASLTPGKNTCQEVGSTIVFKVGKGDPNPAKGSILVRKLGLVKTWAIKADQLKFGTKTVSATDLSQKIDDLKKFRMKPADEDIVTVIFYDYVKASAVDEAQVIQKGLPDAPAPVPPPVPDANGYSETTVDGQTISECTTVWNDHQVVPELQAPLMSGQLKSVYRIDVKSCVPQGGMLAVTLKRGSPGFMTAKVLKVKKFKVANAQPINFLLNGMAFEDLQKLIASDPFAGKSEFIIVMDLEIATPSFEGEGVSLE